MSATTLLAELRQQGVDVSIEQGNLLVSAPHGVLTPQICRALSAAKPEIVHALRAAGTGPFGSLIEYAASRLPSVKMTIRETGDAERDFDLVGRIRLAVQEFQPGGNHIFLKIRTLDKTRVAVEWRALADRELRMALARILASAATPERAR